MGKDIINYFAFSIVFLSTITVTTAQSPVPLKLEECYSLARTNYPLIHQQELIEQTRQYSVSNISKGYFPQAAIFGQATYQSAITEVQATIPGVSITAPEKDQYKLYGEINQVVYDGGILHQQKKSQEVNALLERQNLEVELYKLREKINQLFFGIIILDEQLVQIDLYKKDIRAGIEKGSAAVINGIALKSSLDALNAERLKSHQREIELLSARAAYLQMLGRYINQSLDENTTLQKPAAVLVGTEITRPEILLFDVRNRGLDIQEKLLRSKNHPRFNLFIQGGYGRPALNMLSNEFDTYYLGGIRMQWNLSGFYTSHNEKQLIDINRRNTNLQKETFLFNTGQAITQQSAEISKLTLLMETDDEIITLRENIKNTASAQLENGVITSADFIREVNALDLARQSKILHDIQLLMTQYNQQTLTGN